MYSMLNTRTNRTVTIHAIRPSSDLEVKNSSFSRLKVIQPNLLFITNHYLYTTRGYTIQRKYGGCQVLFMQLIPHGWL